MAEPRVGVTVRDLHDIFTGKVQHPAVQLGQPARFRYSGLHKGGFETGQDIFRERVSEAQPRVRKRREGLAAEVDYPTGQALVWYMNVIQHVPRSGRDVARQVARLCGDDSKVIVPWRSLADAVGKTDRAGRHRAYTERGVQALVESGWLAVVTTGRGRGAKTTFYLMPGDRLGWIGWPDEDDLEDVTE